METLVRLTHHQDGILRRLTFFERSGMLLSPAFGSLKLELRAMDHRTVVREPWEVRVATPV